MQSVIVGGSRNYNLKGMISFLSPQYSLLVNYKEDWSNFQASGECSSFRSVLKLLL